MPDFVNDGSPTDTIIVGLKGQSGTRVEAAKIDIFATDADGTNNATASINVSPIGTDSAAAYGGSAESSITITYTDPNA